jgi:hypothetical protein
VNRCQSFRLRISTSLDGFVAGPNQSVQEPLGVGGEQLHEWVVALEAWRRAHGKTDGEVNESTAVFEEELANIGATDGVGDLHGLALVQTVAATNVTHLKFVRK